MTTKTTETAITTTPLMDALVGALAASLPGELRWQLEGWAAHLRPTRHAKHAANSWAKHVTEFGRIEREAEFVVLARCADFGLRAGEALALLRERREARTEKLAA